MFRISRLLPDFPGGLFNRSTSSPQFIFRQRKNSIISFQGKKKSLPVLCCNRVNFVLLKTWNYTVSDVIMRLRFATGFGPSEVKSAASPGFCNNNPGQRLQGLSPLCHQCVIP
jgi:hypothetical protein